MSTIAVMIVLPALLALAAGWDLSSYTIPNILTLSVAGLFAVFAVFAGLSGAAVGAHLAAGAVALACGFALFAAGFIGGGDAKLFAATAMWFGFSDLGYYALLSAVFGGGLTLLILFARQLPLPAGLLGQSWITRLHDRRSGIPYGVALAAGALVLLPQAAILKLAGLA